MTTETGWAVTTGFGKIFVNTVSDTRRAAIINYLVTEKQQADIENMWTHFGKHVLCTTVTISPR